MYAAPDPAVLSVLEALRDHGLAPAVGGSRLLVALGLTTIAHDWDITVDAPSADVEAALAAGSVIFSENTSHDGPFATGARYVVSAGATTIDILVNFALRGPDGIEQLPSRVCGEWHGLPLADPVVWQRAYTLLGRDAKAALLGEWLTRHHGSRAY